MQSIGPNKGSHGSPYDLSHAITSRPKRSSSTPKSEILLIDDEAYSTDSNSTATDDIGALDKTSKKNKLRFPKFSRKSKSSHAFDKST